MTAAGKSSLSRVEGVWVAVATPLLEDRRIDIDSLVRLSVHLTKGGLDGLLLFGSTGEGPALPVSEKVQAARAVRRALSPSVPVTVGIMPPATSTAVDETKQYATSGIDGLVVTPPYYFRAENQRSLVQHFKSVAEATSLPIIAYNVPSRTGAPLSVGDISAIADLPSVIGVKDSSCNAAHVQELVFQLGRGRQISVFDGSEDNWIASGIHGSDGALLGIANLCPVWCVQAWELMTAGHHAEAIAVNREIIALTRIVFGKSSIFGGLKAALNHFELAGRTISLPMQPLAVEERYQLGEELDALALDQPVPLPTSGLQELPAANA